MKFLIYSREHNAWWGPNYAGYFTDINSAGRYDEAEADRVCANACRGRTNLSDEGPPEFKMLAPEALSRPTSDVPDGCVVWKGKEWDVCSISTAHTGYTTLVLEPSPTPEPANETYEGLRPSGVGCSLHPSNCTCGYCSDPKSSQESKE